MEVSAYLSLARRRGWIVAVAVVVAVAAAGLITKLIQPTYEASAQLFVGVVAPGPIGNSMALQDSAISQNLARSYTVFATSRTTLLSAAAGVRHVIPSDAITADVVPETQVLQITAREPDARRAAQDANAVARALTTRILGLHPSQAGQLSTIDTAVAPGSPVSPVLSLNLAIGALVGLLLGYGIAVSLERLDDRIRRREHEEELNGPVLAELPRIPREARGEGALGRSLLPDISEPYRRLAVVLEHVCRREQVRSLLITSPQRADGKTTVAAALALALSAHGVRVALLDGDFRAPDLAREFSLNGNAAGTHEVLGQTPLRYYEIAESLTLFADAATQGGGERVISGPSFAALLGSLRERFELILIDGAPLLAVADTGAMAQQVDAVLMVVREGETARPELREATAELQELGVRIIGSVVNDGVPRRRRYAPGRLASA